MQILKDRKSGLTVHIYPNDHIPAHVDVFNGSKKSRNQPDIKISLGSKNQPPELIEIHESISDKDAVKALELVSKNKEELLRKWYKFHGS
jgi:hypothetical protein